MVPNPSRWIDLGISRNLHSEGAGASRCVCGSERYLFHAEPPLAPATVDAIVADSEVSGETSSQEVVERSEPELVSSNADVQSILDSLSPEESAEVIASLTRVQGIQQQYGYHQAPADYENEHRRGEIAVLDRSGNWKIMHRNGDIGDAGGDWHIDISTAPVYRRHLDLLFRAETIEIQYTNAGEEVIQGLAVARVQRTVSKRIPLQMKRVACRRPLIFIQVGICMKTM